MVGKGLLFRNASTNDASADINYTDGNLENEESGCVKLFQERSIDARPMSSTSLEFQSSRTRYMFYALA